MGALLTGLLALGGWVEYSTAQQRRELATTTTAQSADRQRLQAELTGKPATAKDNSALEQELAQARQAVSDRQRLLGEIANPSATASRAAVLRLIAQTAPDKLWLTQVLLTDGQLDLTGFTLQPEQLRPWFAQLLAQPALQDLLLRTVVVDAADGSAVRDMSWSFRMVAQARADVAATPEKSTQTPPGVAP
jgi:hypothetical protein